MSDFTDIRQSPLRQLPWATLGRAESLAEFQRKCNEQRNRVSLLKNPPKIKIFVTDEGVSPTQKEMALSALRMQTYPRTEIQVIAPRSDLRRLASESDADFIGFLRSDDILSPAALFHFAYALQKEPDTDLFYCNELLLNSAGKKIVTFFSKAEPNPFNLLHFNSVGNFYLVRNKLFTQLYEPIFFPHDHHDLFFKLTERGAKFRLLPFYFLYRRFFEEAPIEPEILNNCVREHLARTASPSETYLYQHRGRTHLKVVPKLASEKNLVSAIICFRDRADWTIKCIEGLANQHSVPMEIWLVNNQSQPEQIAKVRERIRDFSIPIQIVDYDAPFNYGNMHNLIVEKYAKGNFLLLLNNDVFWNQPRALEEWVAWASQDWVGTVGIRLLYPTGEVQHAGYRAIFGGQSRLARVGHAHADDRWAYENREVFGSTFAACLMKRSTFEQIGGLSEIFFPNGFGDVVFNFECIKRGLKNIYLGHLEAVHLESASRGVGGYEYWEEREIEPRYAHVLERMLRCDLGYNRIPENEATLRSFLKQYAVTKVRTKWPWLKPALTRILRIVRQMRPAHS